MTTSTTIQHRRLAVTLALLVLLGLAPSRFAIGRWLDDPLLHVVVPVAEPVSRLARPLRPHRPPPDELPHEFLDLLATRDARIANLEALNASLRTQLEEFQAGYASDVLRRFRLVRVRRGPESLAAGSRLFRVTGGTNLGIEVGHVAIAEGGRLVGRVTSVGADSAIITPITEPGDERRGDGHLDVVVVPPGQAFDDAFPGTLLPTGEGTLAGVFDRTYPIDVGDPVRLADPLWGEGHAGLLVGTVEAIEPNDAEPLYRRVIVRPTIDLDRVPAVYVRVPRADVDEKSGGATGEEAEG